MIRASLRNPHAVVVLALAILVVGLTAVVRLPTDILPTFKTPAVQVLTFYPGMPAEIMERDITTRLERWTGQANGIVRQEAKSLVGVSIVKDFFGENVDPNTAMAQVTSLAMSDLYYLPPGTIPPMVMPFDPTASIPLALISVSSPTLDETKLYDVAYFDLRNRLQSISGVIAPAVYGGRLRRILAYVDPERAQSRGLAPLDVINAIRDFNVMIPTGNAKFGAIDYQINANGMVERVADLNDLPLRVGTGLPVYVRDVAQVEDSHQIQTNVVRINGRRQVYIPIYRQPGANTIAVVEGIRRALGAILERIKEVKLDVVMDQSVYVRQAIRNVVTEGLLGSLLACAMILVFLRSLRPTFIVVLSLPLAGLGAFIGLYFTRETLNVMTLGGLALVLGLLIDQSIVVLENASRHLSLGKTPREAASVGAEEVSRPLVIITLTIAVVFFPVVFLTGLGQFLFTPLAKTVIFAIFTGLLLSLTLVPLAASRLLRVGVGEGAAHREEGGAWFLRLRASYERALRAVLRRRGASLAAALAAFAGSMLLLRAVGTELFPQTDARQFTIRVRAATGLRVENTERLVSQIEDAVRETVPDADRRMVISNIGVLYDWPAAYTPNSGPQDAFILVQLAEKGHSTFDYVDELRRKLQREFPGTEFSFDTGGLLTAALNFGLASPINVQVEGKDLEQSHAIAEEIRRYAEGVPGAVDARIQQRLDAPQINVDVDRVKAAQLGLTQETIVKNIVTALNSSVNFAPSFWIDHKTGNHYFIGAQYREEDIRSLDTVLDIPVTGKAQPTPVPLRNVARFSRTTAPSEINHLNITRVVDLFVNVRGRDIGAVASDIERHIAALRTDRSKVPEGYYVHVRGEVQSMKESFASLGFGFVLAVALVYLVMVVQFRSFLDPLIVMCAVPLGLIGVAWMLFLTGTYLSIQSIMGVIMMVGIVVSFSVLLVDFANQLLAERHATGRLRSAEEAVIEAARIRLRPILMTALAAVLGLTPMAIAGGANIPLARAVVGGILASVVSVLFVVPILFLSAKGGEGGGLGSRRVLSLTTLLALAGLGGCTSSGTAKTGGEAQETSVPSVAVSRVQRRTLHRQITLPGSIRAYQEATLYAKVAGYLKSIAVDRGDWVKAGQVLAELEVPEMEAEIVKLEAEVEVAEVENRRVSEASRRAPDLVTPQAVDSARGRHEVALANLKRTQTLLEYAKLTAPFSGVVTRRWVDPGAFIPAATSSSSAKSAAVVTVMDFRRVRVEVAMPETEVRLVRAGLPATVSVRELAGRTFKGSVTRIAYALDESTKTMATEIDIENADGALRPGMYASVTVGLERKADALMAPAQAILTQQGKPFAFVVDGGRARKVALQTGLDDGVEVEILGGLTPGDALVVSGAQALSDGQACRAVEAK